MRETMRRFAEEVLRPAARGADDAAAPPADSRAGMRSALPGSRTRRARRRGDRALVVTHALIVEELARGDMGLALAILAPLGVVHALVAWGTAEQQARYLRGSLASASSPRRWRCSSPVRLRSDEAAPRCGALQRGAGGSFRERSRSCRWRVARSCSWSRQTCAVSGRGSSSSSAARRDSVSSPSPRWACAARRSGACDSRASGSRRTRCSGGEGTATGARHDGRPGAHRVGSDGASGRRRRSSTTSSRTATSARPSASPSRIGRRSPSSWPTSRSRSRECASSCGARPAGWTWTTTARSVARAAAVARLQCASKGMKIGSDGVQLLGGHGFVKEHPVERWYRDFRAVGVLEGRSWPEGNMESIVIKLETRGGYAAPRAGPRVAENVFRPIPRKYDRCRARVSQGARSARRLLDGVNEGGAARVGRPSRSARTARPRTTRGRRREERRKHRDGARR